jgi:5-methyltetrahydrofolate--homocysteine methyltransferase
MLRSQSERTHFRCLADYYDEQRPSPIGLFVVTARPTRKPADDAEKLMCHALCARLAEAATIHLATISSPYKTKEEEQSAQQTKEEMQPPLRVAFGYATCPDHSLKRIVFDRLEAERRLGITLTDHYSIEPSTSVCGLFIYHPEAKYFPVGRIDREQLVDYCRRRGISIEEGERLGLALV